MTGLVLLAGVLAGCTSSAADEAPATPASREEWAARTAQMLTNGVGTQADAKALVLPAVQAGDTYTTALALVGAGKDAGAITDSVGRPVVTRRFRSATSDEKLKASIAGPVATAAVLLRADHGAQLLGDEERRALATVLDSSLGRKPADVYEAAAAMSIASSLGHRVDDARTALTGQLRTSPVGCAGSESLFALGAAAEWVHEPADLGCSEADLNRLWDAELAKAVASVTKAGATPGLGEAEAVLALARLTSVGTRSAAQRGAVAGLVRSIDSAFEQGRVMDTSPVAANQALAAEAISIDRTVPDPVEHYLREVVRGEGDAALLALDAMAVPLVHRTARAVGSTVRLSMPSGTATQRLEYLLAVEIDPARQLSRSDLTALSSAVGPALAAEPRGGGATMRGLAHLGKDGCSVPGAVEAATAVADVAPDRVTTGDLTTRALALRVLRTCAKDPHAAPTRAALLQQAQQVLERTKAEAQRPTLVEAWQAASVACALEPKLLDNLDLWKQYLEAAASTGGAKDDRGAFVDLGATFMLATLTNPQHDSCSISGVIG